VQSPRRLSSTKNAQLVIRSIYTHSKETVTAVAAAADDVAVVMETRGRRSKHVRTWVANAF